MDDSLTTTSFLLSGQIYKMGAEAAEALKETSPPLEGVSPVKLEKPLVILPGWTTRPDKFDHLVAKLTEGGRNGGQAYYLQDGGVYSDPECRHPVEELAPEAKVFVAVYHDELEPPHVTAPQVDRSLQELVRRGFPDKLDVIGYSMGGIAARKYLDNGGENFGRVMLLGTSNHGTKFATLAKKAIERDLNWALSLSGLTAAHLPAMEWMAAEGKNGQDNPQLHELNQNYDRQLNQAESITVVGSDGLMTPSFGWWPMRGGDGLVEAASLELPDTPLKLLPGKGYKHHGNLVHDTDAFAQMRDYFQWTVDG